jgi:hypothetical protein
MRTQSLLLTALTGAGLYFLYRYWHQESALIPHGVRNQLPDQNRTIMDLEGNYDIDGVSFDVEGVIVSSDDNKHIDPMKLH